MFIIIYLVKLEERCDAVVKNNIPVGSRKHFTTSELAFEPPTVGKPFSPCSWYSTSTVLEILSEDTFKTKNSIYKWWKEVPNTSKEDTEKNSGEVSAAVIAGGNIMIADYMQQNLTNTAAINSQEEYDYHINYNSLIPVINKINASREFRDFRIEVLGIAIGTIELDSKNILKSWKQVVGFLNWLRNSKY